MVEIGKRIHEKRTECQLTMEQLGNKIGVSKSTINKWEKGKVESISRTHIEALSKVLGCSPAWLMNFHDSPEVLLTYSAPGKESVVLKADGNPIIGETSLRVQLYQVAMKVPTQNLPVAISLLQTLVEE